MLVGSTCCFWFAAAGGGWQTAGCSGCDAAVRRPVSTKEIKSVDTLRHATAPCPVTGDGPWPQAPRRGPCVQGLAGLDIGRQLIHRSLFTISEELPHIESFLTLSPIPGFLPWLRAHLADSADASGHSEAEPYRQMILERLFLSEADQDAGASPGHSHLPHLPHSHLPHSHLPHLPRPLHCPILPLTPPAVHRCLTYMAKACLCPFWF